MENVIKEGAAFVGFKFTNRNNSTGTHYNPKMDSQIGVVGTIIGYGDFNKDIVDVKFADGTTWSYPIKEARENNAFKKPDL